MIKIFLLLLSLNAFATDVYIKVPPEGGGGGGSVTSVNAQTGVVVLTKTDLGLGNVNNTSDANKPVSTAQQAALDLKRDLFWNFSEDIEPNGLNGGQQKNSESYYLRPLQASPSETWNINNTYVYFDPDSTGHTIGATGQSVNMVNLQLQHAGTADIGSTSFFNTYLNIGNGTDPIDYQGHSIFFGSGNINDNVTLNGPMQGYGFQYFVENTVAFGAGGYVNAFYDTSTWNGTVQSYTSYNASPTIANVANNNTVTAFSINPTISNFTGSAGFNGVAIEGNYGNYNTGTWQGLLINPTITSGAGVNLIYASDSNVTASGNVYAAYLDGDVNITGSLTFGGALSIGKLDAYASQNVVDGGGNPLSVHSLTSAIEVTGAGVIANADTFGINTAALITMQANTTYTSGPLGIGLAAIGLPAVLETHTGSQGDYVGGALFAISESGTSTGGNVTQLYGGRFLVIPNGITTSNRSYMGWFQAPFGVPSTDNWGIYQEDSEKNYFEGAIKIGSSDVPTSGMELDVEGDAYVRGNLSVGTSTSAVSLMLTASPTLNFPSTSSNSGEDLTTTVTGAVEGDICTVGYTDASVTFANNDTTYSCWVSAANTVKIRFLNTGLGAHNPASATYKILVVHF